MLKECIEHIQETALPKINEIEGHTFAFYPDGEVVEVRPTIDHPDTLSLGSLDALVKMIRTEALKYAGPLFITIPTHTKVHCFAEPQFNERCHRQVWYVANATDVPGWGEKMQMGFEEAQIALRTRFQETPDALYAMKLLSDISCGAQVIYNDNGIATTVTTKKGVALQTNEQIKSLVKLRPYRTFQEVEQPESLFLIRLNDRGISFIEADGGMWKLAARQTVKKFLEDALSEFVESGAVIIAL